MASSLKSYVEKYLLNPGASFNVDDEGNQETKAQIVDSLLDDEKADSQKQSLSKLRARRAALETEKDSRYSGKKVLRKDLKKDREVEYDPELAKFCILEGSEEEEEVDADVEEEGADEESNEEDQSIDKKLSQNFRKLGTHKSNEESEEDEDEESSDEKVRKLYQGIQKKQQGVKFIDDGDFSKFADDMDDEEEDDDNDDDDDENEETEEEEKDNDYSMETEDSHRESSLKKFRHEDMSDEVNKGQAVKNQLGRRQPVRRPCGSLCRQLSLLLAGPENLHSRSTTGSP